MIDPVELDTETLEELVDVCGRELHRRQHAEQAAPELRLLRSP